MTDLARVRAVWSGPGIIGGGLSTFFFTAGGAGMASDVRSLFAALAAYIPNDTSIQVAGVGEVLDDASGDVVGTWTESQPSLLTGTAGLNYIQGVGARLSWVTGGRRHNRIVRGSTYLVPMNEQAFANGGVVSSAFTGAAITAGNELVNRSGNELRIWSRPTAGTADGASHIVTGSAMSNVPSWLTSRKT